MSTADHHGKSKKASKPGLQRAVEEVLERMRQDLQGLLDGLKAPQLQPVPIPNPVPVYRRRRM
jgi:hypothetical protein